MDSRGTSRLRIVAIVAVAVVVLVAASYAAFAFVLGAFDQSTYTANATADYDYDDVLDGAREAGYTVRTVDSSGFHPDGVAELDAELGPDYEVVGTTYYHDSGIRLEFDVFEADELTELAVYGPAYEPVAADELPEEWLVERITLALGVDEATARGYVGELRAATTDDDIPIPETDADERLQFAAVYDDLRAHGPPETRTWGAGQGGLVYNFTSDGQAVGRVTFIVGRAELTDREGRYRYVFNVDRVGGIGVTVHGPAGSEIQEGELRERVRDRFVAIGLPGDAAEDLEFQYDGSVW
jgi:hypothetical protein